MSWIGGVVALVLLHGHTMGFAANRGSVLYTSSRCAGSTAVLQLVYHTGSFVGFIGVLDIAEQVKHVAHVKEGNAYTGSTWEYMHFLRTCPLC
jgi:hypothetical protein